MIVKILKGRRNAPVGDLAEGIKLSFKATSRHLAVLLAAGIVDREQKGPYMFYCLVDQPPRTVASVIKLL